MTIQKTERHPTFRRGRDRAPVKKSDRTLWTEECDRWGSIGKKQSR
ncbi:hypothetical protein [Spirulina major]|nr:hypothetical protein [Spirulina major]